MNYSKGITWFDDCRIPFVDEKDPSAERYKTKNSNSLLENNYGFKVLEANSEYKTKQGRFPPNLLVCDDMLNDGIVSKSGDNKWIGGKEKNWKGHTNKRIHTYNDKGSNSRYYDIDLWFNNLLNNYIY